MELDKIKELVYNNIDKVNYEERSSYGIVDAIEEAFKEAETKQLTLTDVVASVLCVKSKGYNYITEGVNYNVITESKSYIEVLDDEGDNCYYDNDCFKKL
tara:strand:- start:64 stop:363 length:300 start_codon:yes stop_codon:yes gene_type:complete